MKPKRDTAIQLDGSRYGVQFDRDDRESRGGSRWDLPSGMLGTESGANDRAQPRIVN